MQLINVISATRMLLLNNTFNMTHFKVKIKNEDWKLNSAFVKSLKDVEKWKKKLTYKYSFKIKYHALTRVSIITSIISITTIFFKFT